MIVNDWCEKKLLYSTINRIIETESSWVGKNTPIDWSILVFIYLDMFLCWCAFDGYYSFWIALDKARKDDK